MSEKIEMTILVVAIANMIFLFGFKDVIEYIKQSKLKRGK